MGFRRLGWALKFGSLITETIYCIYIYGRCERCASTAHTKVCFLKRQIETRAVSHHKIEDGGGREEGSRRRLEDVRVRIWSEFW